MFTKNSNCTYIIGAEACGVKQLIIHHKRIYINFIYYRSQVLKYCKVHYKSKILGKFGLSSQNYNIFLVNNFTLAKETFRSL